VSILQVAVADALLVYVIAPIVKAEAVPAMKLFGGVLFASVTERVWSAQAFLIVTVKGSST